MKQLFLFLCFLAASVFMVPSASAQDVPAGWYFNYGLDPFSPGVDFQDPDCDGLTNAQEYFAGGDPTDCDSPNPCPGLCEEPEPPENFKIELVPGADVKIILTWDARPGESYIVEFATFSGNLQWQVLETITGEGRFEFEPDLVANPGGLLRVRVAE